MRQTMRGDKEDSIDGQSTNLDIEIRDVVQKSLPPLNGVRCAVLPLPPSLGFLDIEIRWENGKRVNTGRPAYDDNLLLTGGDRPGGEQKGDEERENRKQEARRKLSSLSEEQRRRGWEWSRRRER
jgi:hypothetical protein